MVRLGLVLLLSVASARADDILPRLRKSLVKLSVSTQAYSSISPWNKGAVGRASGRGVVVQPGVILTPAPSTARASSHAKAASTSVDSKRSSGGLLCFFPRCSLTLAFTFTFFFMGARI